MDEHFIAKLTGKNIKNAKKPVKTQTKVVPRKKVGDDDKLSNYEEMEHDLSADLQVEQESDGRQENEGDDEDGDDEVDDDKEVEKYAENAKSVEDGDDDENMDSDEPIGKKTPTKQDIPIISSKITAKTPIDQIIYVGNIPTDIKEVDIFKAFAKYGTITSIKILGINPISKKSGAFIAYTTAEAAKAALAADGKAKIKGLIIDVSPRQHIDKEDKERTVLVKHLKMGTTEEHIKEHLVECGPINTVKIIKRKFVTYAFVEFAKIESVEAAIKLDNSMLNGVIVSIFRCIEKSDGHQNIENPKRTIIIKNTPQLESFPAEKINSIFSKCGELEFVDILCKKNVLAFITFKDEKSVENAFKLNGTTVGDMELSIAKYETHRAGPNTTILVQNVKSGVNEDEIRQLFIQCGEIENICKKEGFAIVKFVKSDAFCKSFLLDESLLKGQMIFVEPYSEKKYRILKHRKYYLLKKQKLLQKPQFNQNSVKKFKYSF